MLSPRIAVCGELLAVKRSKVEVKVRGSTYYFILDKYTKIANRVTYTGWLKLKYPTGQNAISRQPCEIFTPKCLGFYGRNPATILKFKKNILVFSKVMAV